jgi:hypothetical protein
VARIEKDETTNIINLQVLTVVATYGAASPDRGIGRRGRVIAHEDKKDVSTDGNVAQQIRGWNYWERLRPFKSFSEPRQY